MTWVRYDDNVRNHPKVESLDDATYRLWREAIEWCAQNLTDGVILSRQLGLTSTRASPARARKLTAVGLWHRAGASCDSRQCPPSGKDGWVIHDYLDYQPTRQQVRDEQAKAAERQRNWKAKRRTGNGVTHSVTNAVDNDVGYTVENGCPAPPRPAPEGRGGPNGPPAPPAADGGGTAAAGEHKTPAYDPYGYDEDPAAIAADQQRIRQQAAETARANANGTARTLAGVAAARAAIAENRARKHPTEDPR